MSLFDVLLLMRPSFHGATEMITREHFDMGIKPFRVGELIRDTSEPTYGLALVLRIEWDYSWESWELLLLFQADGRKRWCSSSHFESMEKTDDSR